MPTGQTPPRSKSPITLLPSNKQVDGDLKDVSDLSPPNFMEQPTSKRKWVSVKSTACLQQHYSYLSFLPWPNVHLLWSRRKVRESCAQVRKHINRRHRKYSSGRARWLGPGLAGNLCMGSVLLPMLVTRWKNREKYKCAERQSWTCSL